MKRWGFVAAASLFLISGSWTAGAYAQGGEEAPGRGRNMPGAQMKQKLGLTDDQEAKFKDAMKAHHETMAPIHQQLKDGFKKLADQVKAKAPDADIQATLDSLKSARKAMADEQENFHAKLASFLTPTQQTKLVVGMMMHRMQHGEHHGGGAMKGAQGSQGGQPEKDQEPGSDGD